MLFPLAPISIGLIEATGDPSSSRIVYAMIITLALIGVVLIGLGIWLVRQTKVDRVLLAPLERMADRGWRQADPVARRRLLDDARPEGAEPVHLTPNEPELDSDFERSVPPVPSFDDLEAIPAESSPENVDAVVGDGPSDDPDAGEGDPPISDLQTVEVDKSIDDVEPIDDESIDVEPPLEPSTSADADPEVFAGDHGREPAPSDDDR